MNTKAFAALTALSIFTLPALASAQEKSSKVDPNAAEHEKFAAKSAIELGLRLGYGIPMGTLTSTDLGPFGKIDIKQSDVFKGQIPIWLDVGYRINPNIYVGGYLSYGIGMLNKDYTKGACDQPGVSCSASLINLGVMGAYHLMPDQSFDPWVGVGVGYEIAKFKESSGSTEGGGSYSGLTFLNLQAGGDYKVDPAFGIGPFISLAIGQYGSCSLDSGKDCKLDQKTLHEWFTIGAKGTYDLY